jgi:hypothetical protein
MRGVLGLLLAVCLSWCVFGVGSAQAISLLPGSEGFSLTAVNRDGSPDVQAGSHPFALTTSLSFPTKQSRLGQTVVATGYVKDTRVSLPAGIAGNPTVVTKCTPVQLEATVFEPRYVSRACPPSSQVGMVEVSFQFGHLFFPVYNMVTAAGQPSVFGFRVLIVNVSIESRVRTGGDYGLTAYGRDISSSISTNGVVLTLWGVPADSAHDAQRCIDPGLVSGVCEAAPGSGEPQSEPHSAGLSPRPLLSMPTSCTGPLPVGLELDSWEEPGAFAFDSFTMPGETGCERLSFAPGLDVTPDTTAGGSPTGLSVHLHFPQEEAPGGLAEADLHRAVVTLPAGMTVNPASANGLGACTPEEIGLDNANPVSCPESSKVGTAEAVSPALADPLTGSVYVAQQQNNPFGSLLALYLAVHADGVLVKQAGEVHLDPVTGQVTTTFDSVPQQPTTHIRLHLFGGPRGALVTPLGCGSHTAAAQLTPYSATTPVELLSAFQIASGPEGSGCGAPGFTPGFVAGTTNNQAAAFSPLVTSVSRSDQEQGLGGISVTTPPGLLGILKGVERCGEPQASQGTCGPNSLIGHASAAAGAGPDPFTVQGGQVFLTGPYKGAPFGLSIVVPAVAGPFNLGNVVVRAAVAVDPHTAQITVSSDPLPTILQGIPLLVRRVSVAIDRPGFTFNPTDCASFNLTGSVTSTQGTSVPVASHFQAANCAALSFHPSFKVSTQAKTSKNNGASLDVQVASGAGQANIGKVAVTLPKQLPSRLTTIQQACPEAVFAANPASCPVGSNIGTATAVTPVLASPVVGPAYLVSHGGAAFPDLVLILQGEGVKLELTGTIDIKHGITSSAFNAVPDAPIGTFELSLPEGPHSGLAATLPAKAKGSLCGTSLVMPTTITGQNGAQVVQATKIAVNGCPKAKKARKKPKHKRKRGK